MNNPEINEYIEKYLDRRIDMTDQEIKFLLIWLFVDKESLIFKSVLNECNKRMLNSEGLPECLSKRLTFNHDDYFKNLCLNFDETKLNLLYERRIDLSINDVLLKVLEE